MRDIIIEDFDGVPVTYTDIETVGFETPDGTEEIFSRGVPVEEFEIVPDFSGGDQLVEAAAGTLIKSAILKKPDTLVPENIAKDVEIAGVVGTHKGTSAAGGSGVQKGAVLEIDMEADSVFWARNLATAGQLNLVFTETVTQTGNTLEVL